METRSFGRTGLEISRLTFGCGAVGGLMTKGSAADQDNAVAWAREHGINFFDTAASYGNGVSESNLGRALRGKRDGAVVATKVALGEADMADIAGAIHRSLEASLQRLQMDQVDIFQLHNTVSSTAVRGARTSGSTITVAQVLDEVIPALQALRDAGKIRFLGFTANGDVTSLHQLVACGAFDSAQIFYNLLVPSAGQVMPPNYPALIFGSCCTRPKRTAWVPSVFACLPAVRCRGTMGGIRWACKRSGPLARTRPMPLTWRALACLRQSLKPVLQTTLPNLPCAMQYRAPCCRLPRLALPPFPSCSRQSRPWRKGLCRRKRWR